MAGRFPNPANASLMPAGPIIVQRVADRKALCRKRFMEQVLQLGNPLTRVKWLTVITAALVGCPVT
jgi:hypothetical protein